MPASLILAPPSPRPTMRLVRAADGAPEGPAGWRDDDAWIGAAFAPSALGAQYQPVRELGRGGMGVVLLARERALHRAVAVKLLRPALAASPAAVERFRREARIQAQLEHPGVVPLYAAGEAELPGGPRVPYLAMRYVSGEPLAARLARTGPVAPAEARRLLAAVARALAHAHGRGVVHRDLKPENVLLERGDGPGDPECPRLIDFGVAARPSHDDPRTSDRSAGTPHYMAPEQVAGEHAIDGRTDLYALGALGVAMLSGRPPFAGRTAGVAAAHLTAPVPDVAALAPGAPGDLVRALARCLAKDPAERWPSAAAFADALEAEAAGRPRRAWAARLAACLTPRPGPR